MDLLDTALQAAWEAGDILRAKLAEPRELTVKGVRDMVTDADFAAQRAILHLIRRTYADHKILAEEGVGELDLSDNTPTWVIDPLDGTTNYIRRFPAFSVAIGLAQGGVPVLGVIHDPLSGRTFVGERGVGAHLLHENGAGEMTELRASQRDGLEASIIGVDWPHDSRLRVRAVELLGKLAPQCGTIRALGSAALGLAYAGTGWLDGYYHLSLRPWDGAAGAAIVEAAGGRAVNPGGAPWKLGDSQLIAGAPGVVAAILELMNS